MRPRQAQVVHAPAQAAPPCLVCALGLWYCPSWSQIDGLDLKTLIKDSPRRSHEEVVKKNKTTKQRLNLWRLEGEMLPEPSPVTSPTSPTSPTPPPWWRGSIPPLNYRFVVVAWSISLFCYVDYMPYELPNMIITILCNSIWCILSFMGFLFSCPRVVSCTQFSPAR
jgi:hypothetical protein